MIQLIQFNFQSFFYNLIQQESMGLILYFHHYNKCKHLHANQLCVASRFERYIRYVPNKDYSNGFPALYQVSVNFYYKLTHSTKSSTKNANNLIKSLSHVKNWDRKYVAMLYLCAIDLFRIIGSFPKRTSKMLEQANRCIHYTPTISHSLQESLRNQST